MAENGDEVGSGKEGIEPSGADGGEGSSPKRTEERSAGGTVWTIVLCAVGVLVLLVALRGLGLLPFEKQKISACAAGTGSFGTEQRDCDWEIYTGAKDEEGCALRGGTWTTSSRRTPSDGIAHNWVCRVK
jgi:hypothetical protein